MSNLETYLQFEQLMLGLDARGDSRADDLRDMMDPIWYSMSEQERRTLDSRGTITLEACTRIPVGPDLFVPASEPNGPGEVIRGRRIGLHLELAA